MVKVVKVMLILLTMVVIVSGVVVADDHQPKRLSAWEEDIGRDPIFPNFVVDEWETTDVSAFDPPLLDAVGLAYLPASDNLLIADSEVEETALYEGVNLYEVTRQGVPVSRGTTVPRTYEPVGLSVNSFNDHLFVVSDSEQSIWEVDAGADGKYFTVDDIYSVFSTNPLLTDPDALDAQDPEGIAYNPWKGTLYIIEDKGRDPITLERNPSVLIELDPGPNGVFDGVAPEGDDTATQVTLDDVDPGDPTTDVAIYGAEDISFNHNSGTLYVSDTRRRYILEINTDGEWVRRIDITNTLTTTTRTDGLAYAPSTMQAGAYSLYIADRGDDAAPDGQVIEIELPGPTAGNDPPQVDAGTSQTITLGSGVPLNGTVTDDGIPGLSPVVQYWRMVSGPAAVNFADETSEDTTATFTAPGTYVLRLTASDSQLSAYDQVTVEVEPDPGNNQPIVDAGADQSVTFPGPATLDGTVTDDGSYTVTWSRTSGPGQVTFADRNAEDTTATFSAVGTYVLRLTATDDGQLTNYDEMTVVVAEPGVNQAPVVDAGADQTVAFLGPISLDGTVTDDGQPQQVTSLWSVVSGPGEVDFEDATSVDTTATFSGSGTYVLRLTADDGELTTSDEVTVVVENEAPVVNAGADQQVDITGPATLDGTVTSADATTVTWSKVSGPGDVSFGNANAEDTTATFSALGTYILRLTADDGELTAFDEVTVVVEEDVVVEPEPALFLPIIRKN